MALTKADLQIIAEIASAIVSERIAPTAAGGVSVNGSYDSNDGTHQVIIGTSDAAADLAKALGDTNLAVLTAHPRVPIGTHDPNDQYGPRGSEQTVLVPSQGEWLSLFVPSPAGNKLAFPSIKAPAGERWITHRNANGDIDGYWKFTNDGPTSGDALGGISGLTGALWSVVTAGGHTLTFDDTNQIITIESAGGNVFTLDDGNQKVTLQSAGGLAAILDDNAGTLSLGSGADSLDPDTDGVVRISDLQTVVNAICAAVQPGSGITPPDVTASSAVLASNGGSGSGDTHHARL